MNWVNSRSGTQIGMALTGVVLDCDDDAPAAKSGEEQGYPEGASRMFLQQIGKFRRALPQVGDG